MMEPLRKRVEELAKALTTDYEFTSSNLRAMETYDFRCRPGDPLSLIDDYKKAYRKLAEAEAEELKKAFNENQKA